MRSELLDRQISDQTPICGISSNCRESLAVFRPRQTACHTCEVISRFKSGSNTPKYSLKKHSAASSSKKIKAGEQRSSYRGRSEDPLLFFQGKFEGVISGCFQGKFEGKFYTAGKQNILKGKPESKSKVLCKTEGSETQAFKNIGISKYLRKIIHSIITNSSSKKGLCKGKSLMAHKRTETVKFAPSSVIISHKSQISGTKQTCRNHNITITTTAIPPSCENDNNYTIDSQFLRPQLQRPLEAYYAVAAPGTISNPRIRFNTTQPTEPSLKNQEGNLLQRKQNRIMSILHTNPAKDDSYFTNIGSSALGHAKQLPLSGKSGNICSFKNNSASYFNNQYSASYGHGHEAIGNSSFKVDQSNSRILDDRDSKMRKMKAIKTLTEFIDEDVESYISKDNFSETSNSKVVFTHKIFNNNMTRLLSTDNISSDLELSTLKILRTNSNWSG